MDLFIWTKFFLGRSKLLSKAILQFLEFSPKLVQNRRVMIDEQIDQRMGGKLRRRKQPGAAGEPRAPLAPVGDLLGRCRTLDLGDGVQVDLDDGGIICIGVALEQLRVLEPGFLGGNAATQSARIGIAVGNHPLHHGDVAVDVFDDGLFVQVHGATTSGTLGRSV